MDKHVLVAVVTDNVTKQDHHIQAQSACLENGYISKQIVYEHCHIGSNNITISFAPIVDELGSNGTYVDI